MPWEVGIDEAGYGPNLGPLVQCAVAVHVPPETHSLWELMSPIVRKAKTPDDGRILVDDSKKVNDGVNGLAKLERGVLAFFAPDVPQTFESLMTRFSIEVEDLKVEPWYRSDQPVPTVLPAAVIVNPAKQLTDFSTETGLTWARPVAILRTAETYNRLLDRFELKSNLLGQGVVELLRGVTNLPGDEPIRIGIDKLGGRNDYGPLLQAAFPDSWPRTIRESSEDCTYRIYGLGREIELTFQPKADTNFLPVALASMICKYLRELAMRQFNDYWREKIPEIAPTAGYPVDALRFWGEIEEKAAELGIAKNRIWRRK